ncbi:3-hydroxyacyl-CoA dehydrogenase [Dermacoccaceae bacterium W4C1]
MSAQSTKFAVIGVVGLGTMGAGIVEVFARAGKQVIAVDGSPELAERGKGFLTASTGKQVKRGRLSEDEQTQIIDRVTFTDDFEALAAADLVIEAVPERMEIKESVFTRLDGIVREDAVLASNTSSLSLTAIAAKTAHPQRVVGMHFFNPAPVLKLVEVITTVVSDTDTVEGVRELATDLGKKPVVVGDRAGFVANALLITYLARAIRLYETGTVSREDLDAAITVGVGLPMGPLTLSDLIGLDVVKEVCDVLYAANHAPSASPPALLQQLCAVGRLGRKTGTGFYSYTDESTDAPEVGGEVVQAPDLATLAEKVSATGLRVHLHPDTGRGVLAEIAVSHDADPAAVATARASLAAAEATPVVGRDRAGIVADALLLPHLNDAVKMLDSGYATVSDIDTAMTAGCGYPRGPLTIIDDLGAQQVLEGLQAMAAETGDPGLHPSPLLVEYAATGRRFTD